MVRLAVDERAQVGQIIGLAPEQQHYLVSVMRHKDGDPIEVLTVDGLVFRADILLGATAVRVTGQTGRVWKPRRHITLYQALLKGDHFSEVIDRASQAGVALIVPIVTDRTIVREVRPQREVRWRAIAKEASEQSQRASILEIGPLTLLKDVALLHGSKGFVLHPHPSESHHHLKRSWLKEDASPVALLVGPEGGLSADEVSYLQQNRFEPLSLGPSVYRSENAGAFASVLFLQ